MCMGPHQYMPHPTQLFFQLLPLGFPLHERLSVPHDVGARRTVPCILKRGRKEAGYQR